MKVLGRAIRPRIGFAPTRSHGVTVGKHLPNGREIDDAFATWRRRQPDRPGSAYFQAPFTSPRS